MRTFKLCVFAAAFAAIAATDISEISAKEAVKFSSAVEAYRQGIGAFRAGRIDLALPALEFAAEEGVIGAQIRLARLYSRGEGVAYNHGKAFHLYQKIADRFAEASPQHPVAKYAAEAFVALARYYRTGIPALGMMSDDSEAITLYHYAASYFGDPLAQYELAQMYLNGQGVEKNTQFAAQWLLNASKKNHAPSQAVLGDLLWRGDGISASPLRALALISLALEAASDADRPWVTSVYERVFEEAKPEQIERANKVVAQWRKRYGLGRTKDTSKKSEDDAIGPIGSSEWRGIPKGMALQDGVTTGKNQSQSDPDVVLGTTEGGIGTGFKNVDTYLPASRP